MNTIFINKNKYEGASCWNDLTKDQVLILCGIIFSGMEKLKARLLILFSIFKISEKDLNIINDSHVYDMLMVTDFVLDKFTLTKNLIPEVTLPISEKKLYGPSDKMGNIVFLEFIKCEKFYQDFIKDRKQSDLNLLVATLYRPKRADITEEDPNYDGDIRERYNESSAYVTKRAQAVAGLSLNERHAIYIYYEGCRDFIISAYAELFKKEEDKNTSKVISQGWIDVALNMAGDKFGSFDQTCYTRLYTILAALRNNNNESIRMEEEIERRKK